MFRFSLSVTTVHLYILFINIFELYDIEPNSTMKKIEFNIEKYSNNMCHQLFDRIQTK